MSYADVNGLSLYYEDHRPTAGTPKYGRTSTRWAGTSPEPFKQSPIYAAYEKVAPRVEDWPVLLDKVGDLTRQDYDWTDSIKAIAAPVMLVDGDADSISPEHIVEFYRLLGGGLRDGNWDGSTRPASRLAILPGRVHTDLLEAPGLAAAVSTFLGTAALVPPPMGMPG